MVGDIGLGRRQNRKAGALKKKMKEMLKEVAGNLPV